MALTRAAADRGQPPPRGAGTRATLTLVDDGRRPCATLRWLAGWASVCDVAGDLRDVGADVGRRGVPIAGGGSRATSPCATA